MPRVYEYGLPLNMEKIIFLKENYYIFYKNYIHELLMKPRTRSNMKIINYLLSLPPKTIKLKVKQNENATEDRKDSSREDNINDYIELVNVNEEDEDDEEVEVDKEDEVDKDDEDDEEDEEDKDDEEDEEDENAYDETLEKDLQTTIYDLAYDLFIFFGLLFIVCLYHQIPRVLEMINYYISNYNLCGVSNLCNVIQNMNYSIGGWYTV